MGLLLRAVLCCADMQWLLYELLWRDFFRFITKKYAVAGVRQHGAAQAAPAAAAMAMA
jgi:deoxyribodipyrimidine photolyase